MPAMEVDQFLADAQPEPEKGRQLGIAQVLVQPRGDVEERLLEDVRGIQPGLESRVHTELDHSAEPLAVDLEQLDQRLRAAGTESLNQFIALDRVVAHAGSVAVGITRTGQPEKNRIAPRIGQGRTPRFDPGPNWSDYLKPRFRYRV
jgi:hypothetical protein